MRMSTQTEVVRTLLRRWRRILLLLRWMLLATFIIDVVRMLHVHRSGWRLVLGAAAAAVTAVVLGDGQRRAPRTAARACSRT